MKINTSSLDLTKVNKTDKQYSENKTEKKNTNYSYGVKADVDTDLIDKMEIIAKVMETEEKDNGEVETIEELKNKIEKNQYIIDPMEIIKKIERGE